MTNNLHILVGLDLSKMDSYLIEYMQTLNEVLRIEKITFLHNIKLGELPKDLLSQDRLEIIQKRIKEKIINKIEEVNYEFPCEVKVTMENLSEVAFKNFGKENNFDLLVLGNKQELLGNSGLPYKLLRLFPCPVLMVPETFKTPVQTILSAITFSRYTETVLKWSKRFTSFDQSKKIKILPVHVSKIFYYPLMTPREADRATQEDIKRKKNRWKNTYQDFGELEILIAGEKSVPTTLLNFAENKKADIIILGIKSNSGLRDLIVGSVANELFTRSTNTCLLFVKPDRV